MQWTDGMLYPVLHRLEKQHFIKSGSWGSCTPRVFGMRIWSHGEQSGGCEYAR